MNATAFRTSCAVLLAVLVGTVCYSAQQQADNSTQVGKPNILVILVDDLGYADIGPNGCRDIPTPNIDRLAAEGVVCTDGYVTHPFCSPTRAALIAGRYQQRFGYESNIPYDPHNVLIGLPASERTIAQRLKALGYSTAAFGKWHLGAAHPFHPTRRGFDYFFGFLGGGHDYFVVDLRRPLHEGYYVPLDESGTPRTLDGYLTDVLADKTVEYIRQAQRPFFIYLAFNAPHTPLQAPEQWVAKFAHIQDKKRRLCAAMVAAMDAAIGRVLDALDKEGIRRNTLVFFLSDNGGPTEHNGSRNTPLRGYKGQVYEGGIRVPFVVSWPAVLPCGQKYQQPVSSLDIAATSVVAAGGKLDDRLEGVDLVPYLKGEKTEPPHPALFWRMYSGRAWAVRAGRYKLLKAGPDAELELYDLENDISETRNLAAEKPEVVRQLQQLWDEWNAKNLPCLFPGYRAYHVEKRAFYEQMLERIKEQGGVKGF